MIRGRIDELDNLYKKNSSKLSDAPFIIFCGDVEDVKACYVYVLGHKYEMNNPLEAVQLCFKIYIALQLPFSPFNMHIWSFIQKRIFQITLDRGVTCINNLITKLPVQTHKTHVKKVKH